MPVPAPVTMATLFVFIGCEHDGWFSVGADVAAAHSGRVERHHHITARVESDDAPFSANRLQHTLNDVVSSRLDARVPVLDPRADVMRDGVADPELTDTRRRDRATLVLSLIHI